MNEAKSNMDFFVQQKFITSKSLLDAGFSYYRINQLIKTGILKKINGTTFENVKYAGDENDYLYANAYVSKGVVCLMSAAVYFGLSSFRISQIDVAIPKKHRITMLPAWPNIKLYYFLEQRYILGIQEETIEGGSFLIYNKEKTVCDLIYYRNKYGVEDCLEVLKNYLKESDRNLNKLIQYAEKLKVYSIISTYLEVLV